MNWERGTTRDGKECPYHMRSEDRVFTICKFSIGGQWFYEAWCGRTMLATRLPSAAAAQAICVRETEVGANA